VMLSAETASGKYPRETVAMMAKIVLEAESAKEEPIQRRRQHRQLSISETICESVAHAAQDLEMKAIAVYTETGTTARLISKYRPTAPIFAFAANTTVCARLNLMWGVSPLSCEMTPNAEDMVHKAEKYLLQMHAVQPGDIIAVVAGTRSSSGSTNFMRLHVVGTAGEHHWPASEERRKAPRLKPASPVERRRR
jgi:pyruvate kinase